MKRILRSAGALLVCSALLTPAAQAYYTVIGSGTASQTVQPGTSYATAPTTSAFYKPTGQLLVGLTTGATTTNAISLTSYRTANSIPTATGIASDASLSGQTINFLKWSTYSGNVNSPYVLAIANNNSAQLRAFTVADQTVAATANLFDGAGAAAMVPAAISGGTTPGGIDVAFVAGYANAGTTFGAGNSGVTGVILTQNATTAAASVTPYNVVAGTALTNGTAITANFTTANAAAQANGTPGNYARQATATGVASGIVALHYDPLIGPNGVLYTGVQGVTGGAANDVLFGLGIYVPSAAAGITNGVPSAVTATSLMLTQTGITLEAAPNNANESIILAVFNAAAQNVSILNVKTMHTSTGLSYLILVGGNGTASAASNNVYAIPVVNGQGTSADGLPAKTTVFVNGQYTTPAAQVSDLYTSLTPAVQVGNGLIPGAAATTPVVNSLYINDVYVDGDAVFVAINNAAGTATIAPGIYSSQACFNSLGQIDHWTDWRKVVPNDMGSSATGTGTLAEVDFVAVDSYTGHVFATSISQSWTNVTQWIQPTTTTPNSQQYLAAAVNNALGNICYSVIDLNSSTTGWGHTNPQRLTAFGGEGQVCFADTGTTASATVTALLTVTTSTAVDTAANGDSFYDYTNSTAASGLMLYTTSLPAGAGAVVALGYTAWDADATVGTAGAATVGFFLAGCAGTATTPPALYVFANSTTGAGICPTTFTGMTLNTGATVPFPVSFSWQKVANVSGMPVKFQSIGGGLHVLTRTATLDRIYSTPKAATLTALNNSFVVTASSGNVPVAGSAASSLAAVNHIYDFVISVSATASIAAPPVAPTSAEQLLMLTNDGIYTTSSQPGMQTPSTQLAAGWSLIDASSTTLTTAGYFADYLAQPAYNRNPQTFWFANFSPNLVNTTVYSQNIEYQLNRVNLIASAPVLSTYTESPSNTATFNQITASSTTAPTIYKNFPVLYRLFYSDGARRFFIQKNPNNNAQYQILVLPFNLTAYNITSNTKHPMSDTPVAAASAFYWMQPIGSTGRLMMGTNNGVIALQ